MKVGYARVSTKEQTLDLQVDALKKACCTRIYTETVGGAKAERPELTKVMDSVRAGDVLVILKLDFSNPLDHSIALRESPLHERTISPSTINVGDVGDRGRITTSKVRTELAVTNTPDNCYPDYPRFRNPGSHGAGLSATSLRMAES